MTTYTTIATSRPVAGVGLIRLDRPDALNALNQTLEAEVLDAARDFDATSRSAPSW